MVQEKELVSNRYKLAKLTNLNTKLKHQLKDSLLKYSAVEALFKDEKANHEQACRFSQICLRKMTQLESELNRVKRACERQTVQNLVFDTEKLALKTNESFLKERYHHLLSALNSIHQSFQAGEK